MTKPNSLKTYKVNGMHCTSCATMLELDLEDAGIKGKCDYSKKTLSVPTNADQKKILSIISASGYSIT